MNLQVYAQSIKISGSVTDNSGELLMGVSVTVRGAVQGTMTDDKGEFSLTIPSDTTVLVFSSVGYETQEVKVGSRRIIPVIMKEEALALDEVTVVAFGTQKKESLVASITTINPSELKVPSSNLTTALAGRMAGLISYQRSGEPGADNAEFFIRGVTTFGYKKDPLILIDNNESTTQELSRMQPDDIASFSIMKDATATALYGSRGANGVILVTTKSGKEGRMKLDIRLEESISQPTRMVELADPITYMQLHNEAVRTRNPLGRTFYTQNKIDHTMAGDNPYVYPANDWYDMLFKKIANNHRLNFSVSGGGKVVTYYVSGSVSNDNGLLKVDKRNNFNNNVNLMRYMLRSNINIQLTKTTEMIARMSGSFDDNSGPLLGGTDVFNVVMRSNPVMFPAYFAPDEKNKLTPHILFGNASMDVTKVAFMNPYAYMVMGYKDATTSQMNVQFELKQNLDFIAKGLSLRGMFNTSRYANFDISRQYNPYYYEVATYDRYSDKYTLNQLNTDGTEWLDFYEGPKNVNTATYFEGALNYGHNFGDKHDVGGLLVYTLRSSKETQEQNGRDLQRSLPYRNMSLAGRLTYGYDSRYMLELNFGYNGSERFSKKERFGFFPSAGVAWVISNEDFWGDDLKKTVNSLKLKGSYGLVGNDAIGDVNDRFFYLSNINMSDGTRSESRYFGQLGREGSYGLPGVSISRYANDNITWETSRKKNLTLEAGFFNKLDLQAEIYQENRTNILMTRASIPTTMGLQATGVRANVGEANSKGIDLSLNLKHNFNKDWWITGMSNFTYAVSEFTVYEEPDYPSSPWKLHVGHSINQKWGLIAERLFIDDEEVRNSPKQFGEDYTAGDIKYKDLNGDGAITSLDWAPIGYPTSPEIVYGFGLSTGLKGWDFSFFFQGLARESFWISSATMPFIGGATALLKDYANDHWSEENRNEYALLPRLAPSIIGNNNNNNGDYDENPSTWWMRDGSFLRLKSVEFGYTIPAKVIERLYMTNLRVYFSGTNLLTFSKFKMWDPEMGGNGLGYPVQRVFNFGLQLSF
ncbi:MAG: TonB-dependent receptor [Prevotellaceae bacterium]|nr:TonB-dependent receptor [Prevotellaceae bacterium]